jgi:Kef-type K+ transport system membrane component KefB
MSVTAFPVMARILKDRGMTQTTVGRLALTSTALADVLAWMLLAVVAVLATSQQDWTRFYQIFLGLAALALVLFVVVRPLLSWLLTRYAQDGKPDGALLATLLIGTFACGYVTSLLGVHAVFGAFLFGACLPRDDRLLAALIERIEHIAILALMPIFFALAGLNTTAEAFGDGGLAALGWILVAAIGGKMLGGAWGARIAGHAWRPSLAVGALMNARGLVELIVIKIGLDIGVIDHRLFTLLMIMALVTTVMTSPLLTLFGRSEETQPDGRVA